ncbi:aldehyde dehydrogenase family protein [Mycobacterium koreense]|uniref:aldehyde dehydrogenase (NAD(+)) n=1 Tax=Mycolicibacillus koreensis TaxID=1069220 RepID=A0A7I7SJH7_9MYCO|nr:aldehyde dehydrogenase family protein [Mycolicibacillus koreensis]MCV7250532.1 aldehyde dehydrogenase family protein [Mycolicibacillus koreensis]ODR04827.1 aldehyde dehydrogenase [Mycolicibacillus koreensis]OSC32777.1 aldehyde dehydrogenase family protein [Mycolicibacillus koreensis]BBY56399.1 aldehyde dehydrogenase [Mycolicibacillus koreensis]
MHDYDRSKLFIDGRWVPASGTGHIDVVNPATEEVIGRVPSATDADVEAAVAAAQRAFDPVVSVGERRERLDAVIAAMTKRLPTIAETITDEMGAPIRVAQTVQTQVPLAVANGFVEALASYRFEERIGNSLVTREPYGVVAAITPWNYPLYQVVAKVLPAIAAGCPVVLKPSNEAPLSVFEFIDAVAEAGLPDGAVNLVSGPGAAIGERLAGHPGVDVVSFTGSTQVGSRVGEVAGRTIKKVALELGGKSANVVLDGANLAAAVKVGVGNAFLNGGQTCMAWTRLLVPEKHYQEALEIIETAVGKYTVGDPREKDTRIGPLASENQYETVRGYIERAERDGARLLTGGADPVRDVGYYVAPTVFADVDPDSELGQEEVFGPVLAVIAYTDTDDALRIANGTPYGLSGAVWAGDDETAIGFARQVRTGQLDINGGPYNPAAPFGGYKKSGLGRELGRVGFEEFLQVKSLQLPA